MPDFQLRTPRCGRHKKKRKEGEEGNGKISDRGGNDR